MTVAGYLRISDEDRDKKKTAKAESDSIVSQRSLILEFISKKPEFEDAKFVEYCDDGWSGKNFDRPAVRKMLEEVRKEKIQCIIVKDLSRFGRNYLEAGNYISRVFPFLGVRFIAINDGFDSIHPMQADSLEVSFKTLLYDVYSRDLSNKVKDALYFKAHQGKYIASFAPYGYRKDKEDKNCILPDPDAAENVRGIFQMAADGMSTRQIARKMNDRNILTPMQYKRMNGCGRTVWNCVHEDNFWTPEAVLKILRDERYTGKAVFGKLRRAETGGMHQARVRKKEWITVENAHQGIISQELFDDAQSRLRTYVERGTVCSSRNPLKRKVRCGICGRNMTRAGGRENPYYICVTSCLTDAYHCSPDRISEADLLEIVQRNLKEQSGYAVDAGHIWEERQRSRIRESAASRKKLSILKQTCDELDRDIQELYERFIFGELDKEKYLSLKKTAQERRCKLSEEIGNLEACLKNAGDQEKQEIQFIDRYSQYTQIKESIDDITADVLQKVIVYPGRALHIVWNCRDDLFTLFF